MFPLDGRIMRHVRVSASDVCQLVTCSVGSHHVYTEFCEWAGCGVVCVVQ